MANSELSQIFQRMLLVGGCFKLKRAKSFSLYSAALHLYYIFQLVCFCLGLVVYSQEIDSFAFDLGVAISMSTTTLKILIARRAKYQRLVEEIFDYDGFMNNQARKSLKEEYSRSTKRQTPIFRIFAWSSLFTIIASYFNAIFFIFRYGQYDDLQSYHNKRPIMIKVWIPLDPQKHYIAANLFYSLMVTVVGVVNVASDLMILYPIVYLIFRIQMLKYVLQNMEKFISTGPEGTRNEKYFEIIMECILEHQFIIRKHECFNRMMSSIFFCDFLLRALQIAGSIFIIMTNIYSMNTFLYVGCVTVLLFQLLIQCWYGQTLIDESQSIPTAIYNSDWYTLNIKSRRMMILMILRSQKPLGLRIGPMGMVQLDISIKILKTIYSITTIYSEV